MNLCRKNPLGRSRRTLSWPCSMGRKADIALFLINDKDASFNFRERTFIFWLATRSLYYITRKPKFGFASGLSKPSHLCGMTEGKQACNGQQQFVKMQLNFCVHIPCHPLIPNQPQKHGNGERQPCRPKGLLGKSLLMVWSQQWRQLPSSSERRKSGQLRGPSRSYTGTSSKKGNTNENPAILSRRQQQDTGDQTTNCLLCSCFLSQRNPGG